MNSSNTTKIIIKDLGLDSLSEKEQEEALLSIGRMTFMSVLIKAMEELSERDKDELEKILTKKPNDEKTILNFLQLRLPNLNEIVNEEVNKLKKVLTRPKESHIKIEELLEDPLLKDIQDVVSTITRMPSITFDFASLLISLAYDPYRKHRTPLERRARLFKEFAVWFGGLISALWIAMIIFLVAIWLQRKGIISVIPDFITTLVPHWFEKFGLTTKLLLILIIPFSALVFLLVCWWIILKRGLSIESIEDYFYQKGRSAMAVFNSVFRKVSNTEKITYMVLIDKNFPNFLEVVGLSSSSDKMKRDWILKISKTVYEGMLVDHAKNKYRYKECFEKLKELLDRLDNDEEAVIRFLKPKIQNYKKVVAEETSKFIRESIDFMQHVSGRKQ